ncbi:MAG: hypothetical protein ACON5B_10295 [Myxococcota bacterium]
MPKRMFRPLVLLVAVGHQVQERWVPQKLRHVTQAMADRLLAALDRRQDVEDSRWSLPDQP